MSNTGSHEGRGRECTLAWAAEGSRRKNPARSPADFTVLHGSQVEHLQMHGNKLGRKLWVYLLKLTAAEPIVQRAASSALQRSTSCRALRRSAIGPNGTLCCHRVASHRGADYGLNGRLARFTAVAVDARQRLLAGLLGVAHVVVEPKRRSGA